MKNSERVVVTSRSFSRHPVLRAELLARYEHVTFNETGASLAGDSLVAFLRGHSKAITALEVINEKVIKSLPELRTISKIGVGTDMVDKDALQRYGVKFRFAVGTNSRSVAELVIAFAINMLRHVIPSNHELRAGEWRQIKGRCLSGQTVGLIGAGHVGQEVVKLLQPFGCRVIAFDVVDHHEFYQEYNVVALSLEQLLSESDIVSLHVPLNDFTRRLINEDRLTKMKPSAVLINTARGDLVDEVALKTALKSGQLAAAAFDVFANEPPGDDELLSLPNFLGTPHIGGSTEEAILAMGRAAIAGLDSVED